MGKEKISIFLSDPNAKKRTCDVYEIICNLTEGIEIPSIFLPSEKQSPKIIVQTKKKTKNSQKLPPFFFKRL